MLAGAVGVSHPLSIERARKDFQIYMSKLLEHSTALDQFRRGANSRAPSWGPSVGSPEGADGPEGRHGSPPAGVVDIPDSLSPSYSREPRSWPRAGAVTPPRKRAPLNFSWLAAEPATSADFDDGGEDAAMEGQMPRGRARFGASSGDPVEGLEGFRTEGGQEDDDWKPAWSRRFSRGPIHSEYQSSYPWPPPTVRRAPTVTRSALLPSATAARVGDSGSDGARPLATPPRSPRGPGTSAAPLRDHRAVDADDAGTAVGLAADDLLLHRRHRQRRRLRESKALAEPARTDRPGLAWSLSAVGGDAGDSESERARGEGERAPRQGRAAAAASLPPPPAPPFAKEDAPAPRRPEEEEPMLAWEVTEQAGGAGDSGSGAAGVVAPSQSRAVEVGSSLGGASWADDVSLAWPEASVARGGVGVPRGAKPFNQSSQTIVTEYMDEFVWPTEMPRPGRRGKRTGMGMDHVGRLLAGKRAQEPPSKTLDHGLLSHLATAADRALEAARPRDLAEMCRIRTPSHSARRLLLGLAVALGLRRRRWSDIRARLLMNKVELLALLKRFDKDRPGLTSGCLKPFVDDPHLSPTQMRDVAACMVWGSRWLRAVHDYLCVKEGRLEGIPSSRMPVASNIPARRHGLPRARKTAGLATAESVRKRHSSRESAGRDPTAGAAAEVATEVPAPSSRATPASVDKMAIHRQQNQQRKHIGPGTAAIRKSRAGAERGRVDPSEAVATLGEGFSLAGASAANERTAVSATLGGGSSGGDLQSESVWTAGTVTSRGDVLDAPTEEQVDFGGISSGSSSAANAEAHARDARECVAHGGAAGVGRDSDERAPTVSVVQPEAIRPGRPSRRGAVAISAAPASASASVFKPGLRTHRDPGTSRSHRAPQVTQACLYRHQPKGKTASHFANPKARAPTRRHMNPILLNTRWPPPVDKRERDMTEQRSAFTLEHSFAAVEGHLD